KRTQHDHRLTTVNLNGEKWDALSAVLSATNPRNKIAMKLWEFTVSELTGGKRANPNSGNPFFEQPFEERSIVPLTDRPKFATAMLKGASMAHQVVLVREGNGWRCYRSLG